MSNCCININCPANAVCVCECIFFRLRFLPLQYTEKKNVDNSPAALSIVMELWKYYKSCTFIRVNKYIEPTQIYQSRTLSFSSHLVCKYGHNGNVKSRFSQNERKKEKIYNSNKTAPQSRREEKKNGSITLMVICWNSLLSLLVWIKKYGQIKRNPFQWVTMGNVGAVDISLFMLVIVYTVHFRRSL